jgi:hypothetical protein
MDGGLQKFQVPAIRSSAFIANISSTNGILSPSQILAKNKTGIFCQLGGTSSRKEENYRNLGKPSFTYTRTGSPKKSPCAPSIPVGFLIH